jgi:hypothetical protein
MHAVFIPYGKRSEVELLIRDMEAQKHFLKFDDGKGRWIQGQIRLLPFGVYEYIFPKEDKDLVLHTLDFDSNRYSLSRLILNLIRKMSKAKRIPEYKKDKYYLWIKDNVNIIPLGVRYDNEIYDELVKAKHEAI